MIRRGILALTLLATLLIGGNLPTGDEHAGHVMPAHAQSSAPECQVVPLGAVAPAPQPIFCYEPLAPDDPTFIEGSNSWVDDFNHGASLTALGTGYVQGFLGDGRGLHWRHANHWMVDIEAQTGQYPTLIAAWMRPGRTFVPVNGLVVIEMEVAVPIAGTRNVNAISDSWPELVLSPASAPTSMNPWGSWMRPNGSYLYEAFVHDWAFGCRMQQSRHPICALYKPSTPGVPNYAGGPDRIWEINQNGGDVVPGSEFGGDPSVGNLSTLWATCSNNQDPDTICRNLFRWELTASEVKLYIKKPGATAYSLYYRAQPENQQLGNVLNAPGGFYVYFGDFAYRITDGTVIRFHWDRLAVNPGSSGPAPTSTHTPTPAASSTATSTPTVTATASPTGTATVTPTPAPGQTITFDDRAGQNQVLNGQYPAGVIDWGTNKWWHSGPWQGFSTKSVSFNGAGPTSKTFSFVTPRRLVSLKAYNGGSGTSTVTLACPGQPTKVQAVPVGQLVTIATGWTGTCTTVTVGSTNGWDTNFDDLVIQ